MKITKAPTLTKAIIATAVFAIIYLATTSNLPSCSDTIAALNSTGGCIERQSYLHTASGWLALISLVTGVLLLALKHKDTLVERMVSVQQTYQSAQKTHQGPSAPASTRAPVPVPGRAAGFCATCGTRFIPGDSFCHGCGATMGGTE